MGRQSILEAWLGKFPKERQIEIEQKIRSAPTIRFAYEELKRLKFKGSYDSVQNWRVRDARNRAEGLSDQASKVASMAARVPLGSDPIASVMDLAQELNCLCASLTSLLRKHEWVEPDATRLSNREAAKILAALPSLARASSGAIVEMAKLQTEFDKKSFALALIQELGEDWRRTLEHENPELLSVFEGVAAVTKARLELDRVTVLEEIIDGK